jgi:hypothetical protein
MNSPDTTNISDLPPPPSSGAPPIQMTTTSAMTTTANPTTYQPLDVHGPPNGIGGGGGGSGGGVGGVPPANTVEPSIMNQVINGIQQAALHGNNTMGALPSRDIPMNTIEIQNDNHIRANYIPAATKHSEDYVGDYERRREKRVRFAEENEPAKKQDFMEQLYEQYHIPFLICILYFIFQMPLVNKIYYRYFRFLHHDDGNVTSAGLLVKSVAFAGLFYMLNKTINVLSNL